MGYPALNLRVRPPSPEGGHGPQGEADAGTMLIGATQLRMCPALKRATPGRAARHTSARLRTRSPRTALMRHVVRSLLRRP